MNRILKFQVLADQIFVRNWNKIFASCAHGGIYE